MLQVNLAGKTSMPSRSEDNLSPLASDLSQFGICPELGIVGSLTTSAYHLSNDLYKGLPPYYSLSLCDIYGELSKYHPQLIQEE
jgi:hypothetical protein